MYVRYLNKECYFLYRNCFNKAEEFVKKYKINNLRETTKITEKKRMKNKHNLISAIFKHIDLRLKVNI